MVHAPVRLVPAGHLPVGLTSPFAHHPELVSDALEDGTARTIGW
jgi:hypothetical protein